MMDSWRDQYFHVSKFLQSDTGKSTKFLNFYVFFSLCVPSLSIICSITFELLLKYIFFKMKQENTIKTANASYRCLAPNLEPNVLV